MTVTLDPALASRLPRLARELEDQFTVVVADDTERAPLVIVSPDPSRISRLRRRDPGVAILAVAAGGSARPEDAITCLEAGADDYTAAHAVEVAARARALVRRRGGADSLR